MDAWWSLTSGFTHLKGGVPGPCCLYLEWYIRRRTEISPEDSVLVLSWLGVGGTVFPASSGYLLLSSVASHAVSSVVRLAIPGRPGKGSCKSRRVSHIGS